MNVLQGQIARLPCSGMPDVIPGPPEITFEKEGSDKLLGIPGKWLLKFRFCKQWNKNFPYSSMEFSFN